MGFKSKVPISRRRRKRQQKQRRKYIRYIVFATMSYVFFLILNLPASVAFSFIKNSPQLSRQLQFSSVNGTIWSGSATSVRVSGINIGQLNWNLKLLSLFLGELSAHIKFQNKGVSNKSILGSGTLSISLLGDMGIDNFSASFSTSSIAPLMYGMPAQFGGDINMHIDSLSLIKGHRLNVKGRMVISKASLVSPQRIDYGNLLIQASPKLEGTQLVLSDQGGPLILDGSINIKGNGFYALNFGLGARNSASQDLRTGLRFLGQRDGTGKYHYITKGKIQDW